MQRSKSRFREPLPADLRVAITLYYLAHASSQASVGGFFRKAKSVVYLAVHDTIRILSSK
jgi:hypothetical protein